MKPSRLVSLALAGALFQPCVPAQGSRQDPGVAHREAPDDPRLPGTPGHTSAGGSFFTGSFTSTQVNVNAAGNNIVGDAANEPSIAVDPNNPQRMVIGWRQFDTIASNFRQAGRAYSHDGGQSWTFPGVLEPGVFRSDPVIEVDNSGNFYYYSLKDNFLCDVFTSTDGGVTWPLKVAAYGGDKNWFVLDRTQGVGDGHIYGIWQRFFNCCDEDTLTRSTDGAASFEFPVMIPSSPTFGILDVAPNGDLYAAGIEAIFGQNFDQFVVSRSTDAKNDAQTPTFTTVDVDLGGSMEFGFGPNPGGLLGQAYVRVDPTDSNVVYALASVNPPGSDPLDVTFIRSQDAGATWSAPARVNNDPQGSGRYQWFGTLSVAPDGRIDVIWNDNRNGGASNINELFYAYSYDQGDTWTGNEAVSPPFDSFVGWPQQDKIGDYYDMVSDNAGAHVAYSATFHGEQDVYYTFLFPDCNLNGISDFEDIQNGTSQDVDGDHIPDECQSLELDATPLDPAINSPLTIESGNGLPGSVGFLFLVAVDGAPVTLRIASLLYDAAGNASLSASVPNDPGLSGVDFTLIAFALGLGGSAEASNTVTVSVQ